MSAKASINGCGISVHVFDHGVRCSVHVHDSSDVSTGFIVGKEVPDFISVKFANHEDEARLNMPVRRAREVAELILAALDAAERGEAA